MTLKHWAQDYPLLYVKLKQYPSEVRQIESLCGKRSGSQHLKRKLNRSSFEPESICLQVERFTPRLNRLAYHPVPLGKLAIWLPPHSLADSLPIRYNNTTHFIQIHVKVLSYLHSWRVEGAAVSSVLLTLVLCYQPPLLVSVLHFRGEWPAYTVGRSGHKTMFENLQPEFYLTLCRTLRFTSSLRNCGENRNLSDCLKQRFMKCANQKKK